jgi:hypothetical protein
MNIQELLSAAKRALLRRIADSAFRLSRAQSQYEIETILQERREIEVVYEKLEQYKDL